MRSLSVILAAAMMSGGVAVAADPSVPLSETARVDQLFEAWDKPDSPGCAMAVIRDGGIVYQRGYGMADLEHDVKLTPASVFHVASMSKQFTAAAILLLAQDGRLSLDDQVKQYVPEMPDFGVPITLRHLLHHTSGLRDQWELLGLAGWRYSLDLITDADVLTVLARQRALNFPPGSRFLYSNTGYTLLAQIVKHVSGETFREFTTRRLFRPLGMHHSHFRDDHAEIVPGIAYGYDTKGSRFEVSIPNFDTVGATSLLTTVEDLALWDANFYSPGVGGEALIGQLQERGHLNDGTQIGYAAGLQIGKYRGLDSVDHAGGDAGYRSDMIRFPNQHFSAVTLCNLASINPSRLNRRIADIYLAAVFPPATASLADNAAEQPSPDRLAALAGIYVDPDDGDRVMRLHVEDGRLWSGELDDKGSELKWLGGDRFRFVASPTELDILGGDNATPATVIAHIQGMRQPLRFARVPAYAPGGDTLAEFVGTFRSDEIDMPYRTIVEGDHLVARSLKSNWTLRPVASDLFATEDGRVRFIRDRNGAVSGALLNSDRTRDFRFTRAPQ